MALIYIMIRKLVFALVLGYAFWEVGLFSKLFVQKYITRKEINIDTYYWVLVLFSVIIGIVGGLVI